MDHPDPRPVAASAFTSCTMLDLLFPAGCGRSSSATLHRADGRRWQRSSIADLRERAHALAAQLRRRGLRRGDRVVLLLESDTRFVEADAACMLAGLVSVPLPLGLDAGRLAVVLRQTAPRAAFVADGAAFAHVARLFPVTPQLETVVVDCDDVAMPVLPDRTTVFAASWSDVIDQPGAASDFDELAAAARPDEPLTMVYNADAEHLKPDVVTHAAFVSSVLAMLSQVPIDHRDVVLSRLPLTQFHARAMNFLSLCVGAAVFYSAPSRLGADLLAVRPTYLAGDASTVDALHARAVAAGTGRRETDLLQTWRDVTGGRVRVVSIEGDAGSEELAKRLGHLGLQIVRGSTRANGVLLAADREIAARGAITSVQHHQPRETVGAR